MYPFMFLIYRREILYQSIILNSSIVPRPHPQGRKGSGDLGPLAWLVWLCAHANTSELKQTSDQ